MSTRAFRSKVDTSLALVIVGAFAAIPVVVAAVGGPDLSWTGVIGWVGVGVAVMWWLHHSTTYTFSEVELLVRSSGLSWHVPLRDIRAVTPTRDPLAGPALSLNKLRIDYGPLRSVMVSPADRELFLQELEKRRVGV
jgi:hypothetical protein